MHEAARGLGEQAAQHRVVGQAEGLQGVHLRGATRVEGLGEVPGVRLPDAQGGVDGGSGSAGTSSMSRGAVVGTPPSAGACELCNGSCRSRRSRSSCGRWQRHPRQRQPQPQVRHLQPYTLQRHVRPVSPQHGPRKGPRKVPTPGWAHAWRRQRHPPAGRHLIHPPPLRPHQRPQQLRSGPPAPRCCP